MTGSSIVHGTDDEPGIRRHGRGPFRYTDDGRRGRAVTDPEVLERIRRLAAPPAWTDVWISPDASTHVQATGRDARGRKQYRYHGAYRSQRDEKKFDQLVGFNGALPSLREAVETDLRRTGLPHDQVVALLVALLDRTLLRVGNECYVRYNGSSASPHCATVTPTFNVTQAAWTHLASQRYGRVLNVGSVAGVLIGVHGHAVYDAAKGALAGLTRSLAAEAEPLGIAVNGLYPSADTRCSMSVSRAYKRQGGLSVAAVAPAACWLVHEECPARGEFFYAGGGRMASVVGAVAVGHQLERPDDFSMESIRENWAEITRRDELFSPRTAAELSAFSRSIYQRVVGGAIPS